ncbi:shikimate kinase [Fibrella arboris]|uniref:shikimate kinase n=1 Tax=Fibrella arboris TaxID=3242486 RepID=UPI0035200643
MKNIYLIGMPSSGKTTLGKRLARALHYHFVDTDRLITREEGRSVADIFAQEGEAYFREAEARVLRTIKSGASLVVATGGGMPCFHDNMTYIRQTGISVFLNVSPEVLAQRMITHVQQFPADAQERPLFKPNDLDLLDTLRQKYAQRLPIYQQADIRIMGDATEHDVLTLLGDWL